MRSFSQAVGAEYFPEGVLVQVPDRGGGAHKGRDLSGSSEGGGLETAEAAGLGQGRAEKAGPPKHPRGATSGAFRSARGRGLGQAGPHGAWPARVWAGPRGGGLSETGVRGAASGCNSGIRNDSLGT